MKSLIEIVNEIASNYNYECTVKKHYCILAKRVIDSNVMGDNRYERGVLERYFLIFDFVQKNYVIN